MNEPRRLDVVRLATLAATVIIALVAGHTVADFAVSQFDLLERQAATQNQILDMQVRTFHYAKPHESPILGCPECYDLEKHLGELSLPCTIITLERYEELLAAERRNQLIDNFGY